MKLPLFFNREVKMFPLRHRISIFCWEIEAPRSWEATKMIWLLRNSTIILFGSSSHGRSDVSEQKRRVLRHRVVPAFISSLNLCRSSWAGWGPSSVWYLGVVTAVGTQLCQQWAQAQPVGFSTSGHSFWEGTSVPPAPRAGTWGNLRAGSICRLRGCRYASGLDCTC